MSNPNAGRREVWEAYPWLVALTGDCLHRARFADPAEIDLAAARLLDGETPREVFGWGGQKQPLAGVRSVEWVPAARTLLVKRGWWRDPWRLPFADGAEGERAFRDLRRLLPGAGEPAQARVGPNDLAMDPRLGVGVLLAFLGLIALIGGAVEGVGQAPLQGPARRFVVIAELGEAIGLGAVIGVGITAFLAGVSGLAWWFVKRPVKMVVRRR